MTKALPSLLVAMLAACASNPTPRCATSDDCGRNELCYRGLCLPQMEVDAGASCPLGRLQCDDRCVDPTRDRHHCGRCDNECDDRCTLGLCVDDD